jgi:type III restriction enzyme
LPRDLYKKGGRLMQGAMESFLLNFAFKKDIVLIRDECHIATKNLDDIAGYFVKTINFSATPKLARGQHPDIEIKNDDAQNAKLIKTIEWGADNDTVADALDKFEMIKEDYRNFLGVNPCLIIQISNKDKADEELANIIMPALNAKPDLKWILIVDDEKQCDTNDVFKAKKIPVSKWKDYAKGNTAGIDIIIFKMVISEGWDIPRACMLYQVRDTQSKQLDEQVMGRVRRNPRLLDFETLNAQAQKLAMTAWVWGVLPDEQKRVFGVKLYDAPTDTTDNIKVKTTKLKRLTDKVNFKINDFLSKQEKPTVHKSIFYIAKQLRQADNQVQSIVYNYATDFSKWWEIAEHITEISNENNKYLCDYEQSMEIVESEVSFALSSHYTDNGNYVNIGNWVWKRRDGAEKFSFDSEAEREWADILKDLSQKAFMPVTVGKVKKNINAGLTNLFGGVETDRKIDEKEIYLWGKNYVSNSAIKFEYYMGAIHSSFPDFVMRDALGRIHIFEVKSVNQSGEYNFDNNIYKTKIAELKKCYQRAAILTNQIFYMPVIKDDIWQITRFYRDDESTLSIDEFRNFVRGAL